MISVIWKLWGKMISVTILFIFIFLEMDVGKHIWGVLSNIIS